MPITIRHGIETQAQRTRVIHLLQRVGLGIHLHKRPDEMSGGQNQRCAIVRILSPDLDIIQGFLMEMQIDVGPFIPVPAVIFWWVVTFFDYV